MTLEPLDLLHQGCERVIGVYLLETDDGPALFDCGPASCREVLLRRLEERGLALTDLGHLLLSHIHLDHAGATGVLVREHPGLQVHVSEVGAPHLVDPSRLERSARRLYGERFDSLWGELAPVPKGNIRLAGPSVLGLDCFPAPGHASHHVVYLHGDSTAYCGDAAGVRIQPSAYVIPPTPPPDIDVEGWQRTLDELDRRGAARLALTHFGTVEDPEPHLGELRERLRAWSAEVEADVSKSEFVARREEELRRLVGDNASPYEQAIPFGQSYAGLKRWCDKRRDVA